MESYKIMVYIKAVPQSFFRKINSQPSDVGKTYPAAFCLGGETMGSIKLSAKSFNRSIYLPIITLAGIGAWLYMLIREFYLTIPYRFESGAFPQLEGLKVSQNTAFYMFILFLFISYEFISKARLVDAEEILLTSVKKRKSVYSGQIIFLVLINFVVFVMAAVYNIIALKYFPLDRPNVILYVLSVTFVTYFLNCTASIMIGAALALRFNRIAGYSIIIVFSLLVSPLAESMASAACVMGGINLYPILNLFEFYLKNSRYTPNTVFWYPNLPYRFALPLVWIFISTIVSVPKLFPFVQIKKASKTAVYSALAAVIAVSSAVAFIPSSQVERNEDPSQGDFHHSYYYSKKEAPQKEKEADFYAVKYDVSMKVRNRLHMNVNIEVDNENLGEYNFTLYHGYKIKKITDGNGKKLKYSRETDYVTVYADEATKNIKFVYSGYSPVFYSNVQGLSLPGDFPYYPMPGWGNVFKPLILKNEVDFTVKIDAPYKDIFTNLKSDGNNVYSGRSNAMTFVRGFVEEYNIDSVTFVQSYLLGCKTEFYLNEAYQEMRAVEKKLNSDYTLDGKKVIVVSAQNQNGRSSIASDHIISSNYISSTEYEQNLKELARGE